MTDCVRGWRMVVIGAGVTIAFILGTHGKAVKYQCANLPKRPSCTNQCNDTLYYDDGENGCQKCPSCPPGFQPDQNCGDGEGIDTQCMPCPSGTYSLIHDQYKCESCRICTDTVNDSQCLPTMDVICGNCLPGFGYVDDVADICFKCESLGESAKNQDTCNEVLSQQIEELDEHHDERLLASTADRTEKQCQPESPICDDCEGRHFYNTEEGVCAECLSCPPGFEPDEFSSIKTTCGLRDAECIPCVEGYFSATSDQEDTCMKCRICTNTINDTPCNAKQDTICGPCQQGYGHLYEDICWPCDGLGSEIASTQLTCQELPSVSSEEAHIQNVSTDIRDGNMYSVITEKLTVDALVPAILILFAIVVILITAMIIILAPWGYKKCSQHIGQREKDIVNVDKGSNTDITFLLDSTGSSRPVSTVSYDNVTYTLLQVQNILENNKENVVNLNDAPPVPVESSRQEDDNMGSISTTSMGPFSQVAETVREQPDLSNNSVTDETGDAKASLRTDGGLSDRDINFPSRRSIPVSRWYTSSTCVPGQAVQQSGGYENAFGHSPESQQRDFYNGQQHPSYFGNSPSHNIPVRPTNGTSPPSCKDSHVYHEDVSDVPTMAAAVQNDSAVLGSCDQNRNDTTTSVNSAGTHSSSPNLFQTPYESKSSDIIDKPPESHSQDRPINSTPWNSETGCPNKKCNPIESHGNSSDFGKSPAKRRYSDVGTTLGTPIKSQSETSTLSSMSSTTPYSRRRDDLATDGYSSSHYPSRVIINADVVITNADNNRVLIGNNNSIETSI